MIIIIILNAAANTKIIHRSKSGIWMGDKLLPTVLTTANSSYILWSVILNQSLTYEFPNITCYRKRNYANLLNVALLPYRLSNSYDDFFAFISRCINEMLDPVARCHMFTQHQLCRCQFPRQLSSRIFFFRLLNQFIKLKSKIFFSVL